MAEYKADNSQNRIPVIAVVGPTASGKTALAVALAKIYGGEVVSADSMQIYKGMHIATAKPEKEEMQGIPHHMMDFLDPSESYSVGLYVQAAGKTISDIYSRGKMPILAGGTGLYVSTLLNNVILPQAKADEELRASLYRKLEQSGIDALLKELGTFDKQSAERLSDNLNAKRVIRAIEIYRTTGVTMTQYLENSKKAESPYNDIRIGLKCRNRENLYKKINDRVDKMAEQGLLEEAKSVLAGYCGQTAKMAIGYKELRPYFENEISLEEAMESLKRETRRYAKRQLTWFNRDEKINWIETDTKDSFEDIIQQAVKITEKSGVLP
ncbi:MAG: tRNA (adenosine(37)-N6)-dimethylallyltransferase MiaA [Acutalibacteraceae bacterium]